MQTAAGQGGNPSPGYPISSVDNALRLLRLFSERESVRLTEACAYLGVAHSTAHRLLAMLVHHGYVRQDPKSRAYAAGPALLEIGLAVVQKMDVRTRARPFMVKLAETFDETVHLAALEGDQARFLDAVEGTRAVRVAPRTGSLLPAHCTSAGKALLAELTPEELRRVYADPAALTRKTDRSLATLGQLAAALEEVRAAGYATNYEESEEGVGSVAVPLRDGAGHAIAAIAVAVPTHRLNQDRRRAIAAALLAVAKEFQL